MKDLLDVLSDLVNIDTTNDPRRGRKPTDEAVKYVRDTLESWDIEADVLESNGYYSLYGEIGKGSPVVMFLAHLDVVPATEDEWITDPFRLTVKEGRAYGRGSVDDKGNVAAIMFALKGLSKIKLKGKVLFAFTCDEEIGGSNGAKVIAEMLRDRGSLPRYLINADGSGMKPIIRRRKGFRAVVEAQERKTRIKGRRMRIEFEVRTPVIPTRHSAYFLPGVDTHPLLAASHFLRGNPECIAISIEGAFIKSNVIPSKVVLEYACPGGEEEIEADHGLTELVRSLVPIVRCPVPVERHSDYGVSINPNVYTKRNGKHVIEVDIRAMINDSEIIKEALDRAIKCSTCEVSLREVRTGPGKYLFTDPNSTLPRAAVEVLEELGIRAYPIEAAGSSDSRYFTPFDVECIDFGPIGGNVHGPNEWVDVQSLMLLPTFYKNLALRIMNTELK